MSVECKQIRAKIVEALGHVVRVLDVGAGDCDLVRFLAQEIAEEAIGIERRGPCGTVTRSRSRERRAG